MTFSSSNELQRTPLYQAHVDLGARMVPFAGYEMPVQYPMGVLKEHLWTRENAGVFDISHMGQAIMIAEDGRHETVALAIETMLPADILNLRPGQQRYSQLLNVDGGILDDLMVTRPAEPENAGGLVIIVNAACRHADFAHIAERLPAGVRLDQRPENALLALQGPASAGILETLFPGVSDMPFMTAKFFPPMQCLISRSGYTGEDGYEISVPAEGLLSLWSKLLGDGRVRPIGLGARDTLRLEAGLSLYGHELDETISPVEAALVWSIQKRRLELANFPGAARILREITNGPTRVRVGVELADRTPAREKTQILSPEGMPVGVVTSGTFSPTLKRPVAMGYVPPNFSAIGQDLKLLVRGNAIPARVAKLPFVPHTYRRNH